MAAEKGMKLRVMFQDEARFGRMSLPYACWAPHPLRPKVGLALVREFVYEYAAVSPADGQMTCMMSDKMNTESMNEFLIRTSMRFPHDHILKAVSARLEEGMQWYDQNPKAIASLTSWNWILSSL